MKLIPLTKGQCAIVDDADYDLVSQYKWTAQPSAGKFRPVRSFLMSHGRRGKRGMILMYRFLLGEPDGDVDHINRNPLDNRRCNLRIATMSQNIANQWLSPKSTSKLKGVSWDKTLERWTAYVTFQGKRKHLGCFDDPKEAAQAYDVAALERWGEFALTNKQMGLL